MADIVGLLDCVRVASTTGGTGTMAVGTPATGYLDPFAAGAVSGQRYTWRCEDESGVAWELFEGIIVAGSPSQIQRNRIIRNYIGGTAAVNWPNGTTKAITCVGVSDRLAKLDTAGQMPTANLPDALMARLISTTNVSIPNSTQSLMSFNALGDVGLLPALVVPTSGFTVQASGIYRIRASVTFAANTVGARTIALLVNSSIYKSKQFQAPTISIPLTMDIEAENPFAVGDTVQLSIAQTSGGALNAGGNGFDDFTIMRMRG